MRIEYTKGERASKELIMLHREASEATSGRKMKVLLIYPPDWFPSEPYLSLPSLTAVLRQAGHTVIQKDINLEMYDWYFSEDFLKKVLYRVPRQLDRLRKLSKKRDLNAEEMDLQLSLCDLTRQRIDELIKKAEKAKAIIRGEVFYEIDQLEWAIHVFREVTSVISMVYFPARICMPPMETDLSYKVFVSSEVMEAVNDTQVNVYRDVFEHLVKPVIEQEQPDVVGISIVLQQQMFSSMTFCALIKQHFPHIHVTIGGNTVTRLRDVLPESPLFQYFDSAVVYEGETAFVQLVSAVGAKRSLADVPNTIYKDATGVHVSPTSFAEDMATLPPPDFDGLPLHKYFVPTKILPYLATRGCYWGRCEFCDHGEGYTAGYRTKKIQDILADITYLRDKYGAQAFPFHRRVVSACALSKAVARADRQPDGHRLDHAHAVREEPAGRSSLAGCEGLGLPLSPLRLRVGERAGAEADGQGDDDGRDHEAFAALGRCGHLEPLHGLLRLPWRNERRCLVVG